MISLAGLPLSGIITLVAAGVVLIGVGIFFFIYYSKKNKKPKIEEPLVDFATPLTDEENEFIDCLGGLDNIESFELRGEARLVLFLKDKNLIKREDLKKFSVERTLDMSEKLILVGTNLKKLELILAKAKGN